MSLLQAKEAVDQAKLNVINAQVALYHSELRTPVVGEVMAIPVPARSRIYARQSVTLFPTHQTPQIVTAIDPSQVDQVQVGGRMTFRASDLPGSYQGHVQFVSPVPIFQTQGGQVGSKCGARTVNTSFRRSRSARGSTSVHRQAGSVHRPRHDECGGCAACAWNAGHLDATGCQRHPCCPIGTSDPYPTEPTLGSH